MNQIAKFVTFLVLVLASACTQEPEKLGVRASGPGQTVKASSLSVAVASDQVLSEQPKGATTITAITKSDSTDTSAFCTRGFYYASDAGATATVSVIATSGVLDASAAVALQVASGSFVPVGVQRVMSAVTTAANGSITCLGN